MDRREKRLLRKKIGSYSWALILYYILLNFLVSAVSGIALLYEGFQAVIEGGSWFDFNSGVWNMLEDVLMGNAWGYLIACGIAVAVIRLWKGKAFFVGMFETKRLMNCRSFVRLCCVFFSGQLVFQLFAVLLELILNQFGLSILESMTMASGGVDTFSMFLYMGLGAPIVEELVFRGLILRGLEPYGKRFAILVSAILFGLFHGNLVQSPYAFVVGLVLGYTAMEYSVVWAMVLHMLNNLVLGDSLLRLLSWMPEMGPELVIWGLILACSVAAVRILWKHRALLRARRREDPIAGECLLAFFTAFPTLILFLLMGWNAALMLFI